MFLRDSPSYNILIEDVEFEDTDIERGIRFAVARYNAFTPVSNIQDSQMNEWVLLCGVVCILLRSEAARQLRNQVTANDGNIAGVGIDEKQALYVQMAEWYCQEFEEKAKAMKIQFNMEGGPGYGGGGYGGMGSGSGGGNGGAYGELGSGYRWIGRWTP